MNKRILFTDLDGTLLDDQKNITPGNHAAIDEALAQGHIIVISTGRPLVSAMMQAHNLGLDKEGCYVISYNGSQIYDIYHQKTLYGKGIARELAAPLFRAAAARGLYIQTYNDTHILTEHDGPELQQYTKTIKIPYHIVDDIDAALTDDPYKLIAIDLENQQTLYDFQNEVLSQYQGILDSFYSHDWLLEIVPAGVSKGFAVRWMCDYLGIPIENSVAAGDAQNDIAMLEAAHVGAVMCNAFPGIAEHGNYVTQADNNHDGVAEIIHKFILCDAE
jgi:hypothetical protein